MTTKSRLALLSTLATTPLFAAPFLAIGDNAELFLTGRVEVRHEDNVTFTTDANKIDDVAFEIVPGAQLLFGKNSLTKGSLTFTHRIVRYTDNSNFDDELSALAFNTRYQGAKLSVTTDAAYRELNQNSRTVALVNSLVRYDVVTAGVNGELALTAKSKVGSGIRYTSTDYKPAGFTDNETYTVPVNYYFAITPKVDLSAGLRFRYNDVDAPNRDSEEIFYNVGARGEFTPKLTGGFSVGYATRSPDVGNDRSSLGLDANFAYAYSPKTSFTLNFGNDFSTTSSGTGEEVASVDLGVRSAVSTALTLSASVGYSQIDYIGTNREDDYVKARSGAVYNVNQYMSVEAYYNYYDNSSNAAPAEFTSNIFTLAANFRY